MTAKRDELLETVHDMRNNQSGAAAAAELRQETLQLSLQETQARLAAMEAREEEAKMAVPEATRPLIQQIESLQAAGKARAEAWHSVEASLRTQLGEAVAAAEGAEERARHSDVEAQEAAGKAGQSAALATQLREEVGMLHGGVGTYSEHGVCIGGPPAIAV